MDVNGQPTPTTPRLLVPPAQNEQHRRVRRCHQVRAADPATPPGDHQRDDPGTRAPVKQRIARARSHPVLLEVVHFSERDVAVAQEGCGEKIDASASVDAKIATALISASQNLESIRPVHGSLVSSSGGSCT